MADRPLIERGAAGRLGGRTAVVAGVGSALGRACALAFAREGAEVLAVDPDESRIGVPQALGAGRLDLPESRPRRRFGNAIAGIVPKAEMRQRRQRMAHPVGEGPP